MCYRLFGVVCLVCSVVVFCVVSQNKEETAECFSYSDFMLFCDFRSIVLI